MLIIIIPPIQWTYLIKVMDVEYPHLCSVCEIKCIECDCAINKKQYLIYCTSVLKDSAGYILYFLFLSTNPI